jgi:hypothetical protein
MKRIRNLGVSLALAALVVAGLLVSPAAASTVTTSNGTWTAYPGQSTTYGAAVQQPINADGTSNFKANGKTVIPVKFALSQGTGAFAFESIFSDNPAVTSNDYSFLSWRSNTGLTLADITQLSAVYAFTDGDCAGGSLRWTVRLNDGGTNKNLDIHYQPGAGGVSQQTCAAGTSGQDMADPTATDPYVVTQEFNGTHSFSNSYNVTYGEALTQLGNLPVVGVTLIVDSGWGANGDQVVNLTSATVGTGTYTETFTPQSGSPMTTTCPTAEAKFSITKIDGSPTGDVNEPLSIQPQDDNKIYRIVDCKYMYNLATSSLSGVGTYTVKATIGTTTFTVATFDLK